jgi:hypothetical protein
MMLGVTAEQIAGWDAELSSLTGSLGYLFNRPEPRVVFAQFIEGLLAELPKKNGWTLSERAGHVTACGQAAPAGRETRQRPAALCKDP